MVNNKKIEEIKKKRFEFLKHTYELVNGSTSKILSSEKVSSELGFKIEETVSIVEYLDNEGLIEIVGHHGNDCVYNITHDGIVEIETALTESDISTEHFPAYNLMYIEQMSNSQIQQGTKNSNISLILDNINKNEIKDFIEKLEIDLKNLNLDKDTTEEVQVDLSTLKMQLNSPKPKVSIILEGLKSLRAILEGVTGSIIASEAGQAILQLIQNLS